MKKLFKMAGLFLVIFINANVNAQEANVSQKEFESTSDYAAKATANDRAIAKFGKFFPNASSESWTNTKNGFAVRFTSNNMQQLVFLTKHGNVIASIKYYSEKQLPSDVRMSVRYAYPDYSIKSAREINAANSIAYLITIEDATSWKTIRIVNGDMDVYEEYKKSL
jgi:hypothetical protein